MNTRLLRRSAVVAVAAACLLAATGCSSSTSDAATVSYKDATGTHTSHIAQDAFMRDLRDVIGSKQYQKLIANVKVVGDNKNTTDPRFSAFWLSNLITQTAVDAEFNSDHLKVTPQLQAQAAEQQKQTYGLESEYQHDAQGQRTSFTGPGVVFESFPKSLQNKLIDDGARLLAVYQSCASGRLAEHILVKTKAEADALYGQIKNGADFATLAKSKSTDTGSAQLGGVLGCLGPNEFVPAFQSVAEKVPFDVVTVPVKSQFGYHLILVRKWDPQIAAANPQIGQSAQQFANAAITARLKALKVRVDPRYGTWGAHAPQQQGGAEQYYVDPPVVPTPCTARDRCDVTTTTAAAPAG